MQNKKSLFRKNLDLILFSIGAAGFAAAMYCGLFNTSPVVIYKSEPKTIEAKVIKYEKPKPALNTQEQCSNKIKFNYTDFPAPFVANGIPSAQYVIVTGDNITYSK